MIKNYRLTLIKLLVSCSLLNAMEKQTNKQKQEINSIANEVTCETERINMNNNKPIHLRSPRKFHEKKDNFVEKIINKFCKNSKKKPYLYTPDSRNYELTEKKYNELENKLKLVLTHCTSKFINSLIQEWKECKKKDNENWEENERKLFPTISTDVFNIIFLEVYPRNSFQRRFAIDMNEVYNQLKSYGYEAPYPWGPIYKPKKQQ